MGTTYYVSTRGSDRSGNGSTNSPWGSIQQAINRAGSGDTIVVEDGTYRERLTVNKSVTIQARNRHRAVIDGGWSANGPGYGGYRNQVTITAGATLDGLKIQRSDCRGIAFDRANNAVIKNCHVFQSYIMGIAGFDSRNVTVQNCWIEYCAVKRKFGGVVGNRWSAAATLSRCSDCTFEDNRIWDAYGEGFIINRGCNQITVRNNEIYDNSRLQGYLTWSRNCEIYNNAFYHTSGWRNPVSGAAGSGFEFRDEEQFSGQTSSNNRLYNNVFVNCGLWSSRKANMVDSIIEHNTVINGNINISSVNSGYSLRGLVVRNNVVNGGSVQNGGGVNVYSNKLNVPLVDPGARRSFPLNRENYHQRSNAASIDTAVRSDVPVDYRGARRRGTPDCGFHEYDGTVTIPPYKLTALFAASTSSPMRGETVALEDRSVISRGEIDRWLWEYSIDDGAAWTEFGTEPDATLTVRSAGDYIVRLTVVDEDESATDSTTIRLEVSEPEVQLVADFTMNKTTATVGDTVSLVDNSTISRGEIDSWTWKYSVDDGITWTEFGTEPEVTLTVEQAGEYLIRLTVSDNEASIVKSATKEVLVGEEPLELTADFVLSSESALAGDSVSFIDASTISRGDIDSWQWEYSLDGGVSWTEFAATQDAELVVGWAGNYLIRLTVSDLDREATDSAVKELVVVERPEPLVAEFSMSNTILRNGDTLFVEDQSSIDVGEIDDWSWAFSTDSGSTWTQFAETPSAALVMGELGTYLIRLTVSDTDRGLSASETKELKVVEPIGLLDPLAKSLQTGVRVGFY